MEHLANCEVMTVCRPEGGFGIDLTQAARNELDFLTLVDECYNLCNRLVLKNAIRRYEVFWLPLALSKQLEGCNSVIAAPLDIAWVWHVHMLAPYNYEQDCFRILSGVVDHTPLSAEQRVDGLQRAKRFWEETYPEEPFEVNLRETVAVLISYNSKIQYNLEEACHRQFKFYYQVSLPHYRDNKFLMMAVERYQHHLQLKKKNPQVFMVPCYDFDLIWHVHQLHPLNYNRVTAQLLGRVLHHDDTASGRTPGSKLYVSEMETRAVWKAEGLNFVKSGAMYRGDPPARSPLRQQWLYVPLARSEFSVDILKIEAFTFDKRGTFLVQIEDPNHKDVVWQTFKRCGCGLQWNPPPRQFAVNNERNHTITVRLYRKKMFRKKMITEKRVSLLSWLDTTPEFSRTIVLDVPMSDAKHSLRLIINIDSPTIKRYFFTVSHGTFFGSVNHLASELSFPRLMVSPSDLSKQSLPGEISTYRVFDWRRREVFKCRIIHSASAILSAVEVIDVSDDKVVAVAHTVNPSTLPERDAIEDEISSLFLNQVEGERAMLIRGQEDWGVCIGKWEKGSDQQIKDSESFLRIKFFKLFGKRGWCSVQKSPGGLYVIKIASQSMVRVDLKKSQIIISPRSQDIPEIIALAVSVAVLYVLCMPYSPRETQESAPCCHRAKTRTVSSMLYVAGYSCMTVPTNVYLKSRFGVDVCSACGATAGGGIYDLDLDKSCDVFKGSKDRSAQGGWVGQLDHERCKDDSESDIAGEVNMIVGDHFTVEGGVCVSGGGCAGGNEGATSGGAGDSGGGVGSSCGGGDFGGGGDCGGGGGCGGGD